MPPSAVNRVTNSVPPLLHSAHGPILTDNATLSVQARFNNVFLKTLVRRLENASDEPTNRGTSQNDGVGDSKEHSTDSSEPEFR